jgi:hypothetical protein
VVGRLEIDAQLGLALEQIADILLHRKEQVMILLFEMEIALPARRPPNMNLLHKNIPKQCGALQFPNIN